MSFLLRATLVIGTLSYLAATRGGPADGAREPGLPEAAVSGIRDGLAGALPAVWNAVPKETREGIARDALAELSRRATAVPASRDTLAEMDRRSPWRGIEGR